MHTRTCNCTLCTVLLVMYLIVLWSTCTCFMFNDQTCFCRTATNSISSFPLLLRVHLRLILILNAPFSTSSSSFFFSSFLQQMTKSKSKKNQKTIKSHPTQNGYKTSLCIPHCEAHSKYTNNQTILHQLSIIIIIIFYCY